MARLSRSLVATFSATCAFCVLTTSGTAFSQPFNSTMTTHQRMDTRNPTIEHEIQLGNDYLSGNGVIKDEKQAAFWYEKAAEAGDPAAEKQIGFCYETGIGVPADPVRAVHWYQLAAAAGLVSAKTNLGVAYLWGSGVAKDVSMAAEMFREAADKGDGRAATYMGNLYCLGNGVPQDRAACEHWYTVGAKRHDPLAEFDLGILLSSGDPPQDFDKAVKWLRKAVAGGYVPAMHTLALVLEAHPDLANSGDEFLKMFEEASSYGQWKSSEALGNLYDEGRLIPRNPGTAYYYLELAVLQGGLDAPRQQLAAMLGKVSAEMENGEVSKQEAAARSWYSQHPERIELLLHDLANHKTEKLALAAPATGNHAGQIIATAPDS